MMAGDGFIGRIALRPLGSLLVGHPRRVSEGSRLRSPSRSRGAWALGQEGLKYEAQCLFKKCAENGFEDPLRQHGDSPLAEPSLPSLTQIIPEHMCCDRPTDRQVSTGFSLFCIRPVVRTAHEQARRMHASPDESTMRWYNRRADEPASAP